LFDFHWICDIHCEETKSTTSSNTELNGEDSEAEESSFEMTKKQTSEEEDPVYLNLDEAFQKNESQEGPYHNLDYEQQKSNSSADNEEGVIYHNLPNAN